MRSLLVTRPDAGEHDERRRLDLVDGSRDRWQ
jgi:hypothetical protein